MGYARDSAMTALIFGFFASAWFGWAQERPPKGWRGPLIAGAVLSLVVAVVGGVTAWRVWSQGSVFGEPGTMRQYGITVGVEFAIAAVGAVVISLLRRREYIAPWICLVVGVHFWPLAPVLRDSTLYVLGVVLTVVAVAAVLAGLRTKLAPSAVAGVGAGVALLGFAAWNAVAAIT